MRSYTALCDVVCISEGEGRAGVWVFFFAGDAKDGSAVVSCESTYSRENVYLFSVMMGSKKRLSSCNVVPDMEPSMLPISMGRLVAFSIILAYHVEFLVWPPMLRLFSGTCSWSRTIPACLSSKDRRLNAHCKSCQQQMMLPTHIATEASWMYHSW